MHMDATGQSPEFEAAFGLFKHLNTEELQSVISDDNKFEEILKDVKQDHLDKEKEILLVSNRSLAEYNLKSEPELNEMKQKLVELSELAERMYLSIEEKSLSLNSKFGTNSTESLVSRSKAAVAQKEQESDRIADDFLNRELTLETFLEQFLPCRTAMHLRRVKADKIVELLKRREPNHISNSAPYNNIEPSNFSSNLYRPPIPYPLGHDNGMPTPSLFRY